jgi:hypothetical protein
MGIRLNGGMPQCSDANRFVFTESLEFHTRRLSIPN